MNLDSIARLDKDRSFGATNGGWAYDAYPELETLDAGRTITIGAIEGPAVITQIHSTQHFAPRDPQSGDRDNAVTARGVILEIYYDEVATPAVRVPLADFFADGCAGRAVESGGMFVEKAPGSYNSYIPMPFAKSARVVLRNETKFDLSNYSFVEFERLPKWEPDLGYFHASWKRFPFQLHGQTNMPFFHIDGSGHLIGRAWSICTDDPFFENFHFVMEGNNEVRIDGDSQSRADYLGTEDSFGFSWGFRQPYSGPYCGMNFVQAADPTMLSIYRFRKLNPIRFNTSLDWRVNWSYEWRENADFQHQIAEIRAANRGWVDYAVTYYWYQDSIGFEHSPLLDLEERTRPVLRLNQA